MRTVAAVALPFSGAVFASQYLLPGRLWLPAGMLCAVLALLTLFLRGDRRLRLLLVALGLSAGFLWCRGYDLIFYAPAQELDGRTVVLDATVEDWPRETDYGVSLPVRVHAEGRPDFDALLYAEASQAALEPGDEISVIAACRLAERTKGGEEITYYTSRGVFLIATAYGEITVTQASGSALLRYWPLYAARALKQSVAAVFPTDAAPLMTALLTGDKDDLGDALYSALRRTGLAHVVAVSGMHLTVLAALPEMLPGARRRRLRAAAVIILSFGFAAVVGNTPSVLRAAFLCACMQLAPLVGRENDTPTSLSVILAGLLLQNPRAAANVSLQLTFAAVAGIYLFSAPVSARLTAKLPKKGQAAGVGRALAGIFATSLGAMVFTIPIAAYYFGMVPLIAPFTNLIAVPLVWCAFALGLAAALFGLIAASAGMIAAWCAALPLRALLLFVPALGKLPFAAVTLSSVYYAIWLVFAYAVLAMYLLWRGEKKRPVFPLAAVAAVLCAAVIFTRLSASNGSLIVTVLDVGQGQCVLLQSGGSAALADCGGGGAENAGDTAADRLHNLGKTSLDLLVLSHFDGDHVNGVPELFDRLDILAVALPDASPDDPNRLEIEALAAKEGAQVLYVTARTEQSLGIATLILFPPQGGEGDNENGLAVQGTAGDFDVLITGDMSSATEARLIKYNDLPDIELLVVGHHGSKYSTSEDFLDAVTPETAVISVGYNSYGHPTEETLERLEERHIAVYRTDQNGSVTISSR
jgi:competence protein ComEC